MHSSRESTETTRKARKPTGTARKQGETKPARKKDLGAKNYNVEVSALVAVVAATVVVLVARSS